VLGPLRYRNYRLFWSGSLVSNVGFWMQQIALGWLVYGMTRAAQHGWATGARSTSELLTARVSLPDTEITVTQAQATTLESSGLQRWDVMVTFALSERRKIFIYLAK